MTLHEYLFYTRQSIRKFAKTCDLSASHLYALMKGELKASDKTMRIIDRVTQGRVKEIGKAPSLKEEKIA